MYFKPNYEFIDMPSLLSKTCLFEQISIESAKVGSEDEHFDLS